MLGTLPPGKIFVGGDEAGPCTARPNRRSRRPLLLPLFIATAPRFTSTRGPGRGRPSAGAIGPVGSPPPYGRRIVGRLRARLERRERGTGRGWRRASTGLTATQNRPHASSSIRIANSLTAGSRSGHDTELNAIGVPLGYDL